jgi:thymidine phosphorylase
VPLSAARSGFIAALDARALGELAVALGAGRSKVDQAIDPRVGIELCVRRGEAVERGQTLGFLHLRRRSEAPSFAAAASRAIGIAATRPRPARRVLAAL